MAENCSKPSREMTKKKLYRKKTYEEVRKRLAQAGGGAGQGEEREYDAGDVSRRAIDTTVTAVSEVSKKLAKMIAENPVGMLVGALLLFILLMVLTTSQMAEVILGGMTSGVSAGTYIAEDSDIYAAEAYYAGRERALRAQIDNTQLLFPGYDEYRLPRVSIGHDPWTLASTLTVLYGAYTRDQAQPMMDRLFSAQYEYRAEATTETRYRWEERIGYRLVEVLDEDGNVVDTYYEEYTYYVRVPYEYRILTVRTTNRGLDSAVSTLGLDEDTMELLNYLTAVKGEKDYLWR
ncbi:hypothetical protein SAMN02910339_01324 [Lachnospiraceae bacterium YSD2013]|nr:hypothetical protein SAMN02910339_01324 [Lachnospiraceae bacterium YSD2013]